VAVLKDCPLMDVFRSEQRFMDSISITTRYLAPNLMGGVAHPPR